MSIRPGHTYAMGYRISEVPVKVPECELEMDGLVELVGRGLRYKRRVMFRAFEKMRIPGYVPISADINDPNTLLAGYRARLLRNNPKRDEEYMRKLPLFTEKLVEFMFKGRKVKKMTFKQWLETTSYSLGRKKQLEVVEEKNKGCLPPKRKCQKVKGFGKTECNGKYKTPRNIMSRVDEVKVIFGPLFKAIELVVYESKYFVKHLTPEQKMERVRNMVCGTGFYCFESDYSGWESVFDPEMMKACEFILYKSMLSDKDFKMVETVLAGKNRISGRGYKVTCQGKRCSGEMNTSLGNGFSNLCLTLFLIWMKIGEPEDVSVVFDHYDGIVEGDDQLAVTDVELSAADFEKVGITIKMQRRPRPCEASFCGMVFTSTGEIVREPRRFLEKFCWTGSFLAADEHMMDCLLRAKALSTLFETPQCPIVAPLAHRALELTRGVTPRFVYDGYHEKVSDEFKVVDYNPSHEVRVLFASLYGISVSAQIKAEQAIMKSDFATLSEIIPPSRDFSTYEARYVLKL